MISEFQASSIRQMTAWTGRVCVCESETAPCANPAHDPTTRVMESNGTVIYYTCRPGFRFESGDLHRLCDTNGTWSGRQPICTVDSILFHHDYAPAHTAQAVTDVLAGYKWELLEHPRYSPDFAPCDFHLFPKMKEHLRGHQFETEEDIIQATKVAIKNLDKCSYVTAFKDSALPSFLLNRFRKRKKKVRDHQERLSLVTRIAPGHAKVIVETVSSEDGDGHGAHHPRKFGFKSLLSVFKFMAGGKLKAGPPGSTSDVGGDGPSGEMDESLEGGEESKCSRSNGYRSVPTSSPRSNRGQTSFDADGKDGTHKPATPSAKSLVMTPHICRHKSCEHQPKPSSHGRAPCLQRSSSDNPPSYSSLAVPVTVSSHSATAISGTGKACARYGNTQRSFTLELADVIAPASDSGTPTPTMSAPTSKKGTNGLQIYNENEASGAAGCLQQGGVMYPYAYSPDYEEIETPRRAPNFFRGGAPPPNSRTNSSGTLIMSGAFGGKQNRQHQQGSYSGYSGGRSFHQHQPDFDYESHSFSSQKPNYGSGAVPKQNPAPRSGLLVFQKASEIFHRRLEAKRTESPVPSKTTSTSEDHWSFAEPPARETDPSHEFADDKSGKLSRSFDEPVIPLERQIAFKSSAKQQSLETRRDVFSKAPCKENCLTLKNTSIISPARRSTLATQPSQNPKSLKNRRFHRSMAKSYSQQADDDDYLQTTALLGTASSQADNPTHVTHLTCLSKEEVNVEEINSDSDHQPRYSMPFVAESPTMKDDERSLRFSFCPISSSKESFDSAAQEDVLSLPENSSFSLTTIPLTSKENFDSSLTNFPDLISNEMCSLAQASTSSPSKDTIACSNSSGKTTPEGSDSTVVLNTVVTSPQEESTLPLNTPHHINKDSTFEDPLSDTSHHFSSKDKLWASKTSQIPSSKSITPTTTHFTSTDLCPGFKPLTRTGSCSSPLGGTGCLVARRTSPPSSTSSPDVLQLRHETAENVALPHHKSTSPRYPSASSISAVGSNRSKPSVQYKGVLFARHYSLENP
ncbi:histone-lysine N-methyltransferase SETMAR [Elysia marginata]|uniref:Histone-lysine N-methyltransferase SETMAR n=1 Tax=Elysia marginata TaxID=1093978 RepID=A0AAV4J1D2_9GAST|nr:histone-lysine N-methyltransferase SETMAR [Elysia marginata]